ncbi:flagellar biosynthesis regulator FlaF [Zavarzinia compransoris]|uniref:flagellar biosynthesis regulator FlaF n=1 Tax=Zavarzinia marina TaxID=2911065 RepID=UPI001F259A77|nr:flagellar biosynthesis regulator FlaF [Zavarzinia marina]MCF4166594.1 flagellar biosynthesis regulator FlaF [Zavarzinia marina]
MYPTQRRPAYSKAPPQGDPRRTEGWALTEAARRMAEAQRAPDDKTAFLDAVRRNWRLWTIFQAGITSPDSELPTELRANVLSLSNFIDRHTVGVLADPQPEKLDILIRINREIAAGLLANAPGAETAPTAPAPSSSGGINHSV